MDSSENKSELLLTVAGSESLLTVAGSESLVTVAGQGLEAMIADYMEKGFLDNIVDMLKYDAGMYIVVAGLLRDERLRVRIGAIALIEALKEQGLEVIQDIADSLLPLLGDDNPSVRGDTAYAFGIIGQKRHVMPLEQLLDDKNMEVAQTAHESIDSILSKG
ncbi:MAG: HEAT repeat domain-containing protein [Nitrospirae bacterium]|nr:HEAT repeat domain-containing protein [Nitrospirota bacterium]